MNLAGLVSILSGGAVIIGLLVRIVWVMGKLVQQFGDHMTASAKIHDDQERRIRDLERRRR